MSAHPTERWQPISLEAATQLLDLSGGRAEWESIARDQLLGAVDLYARLGQRGLVWLCDEVGLGKTFVALALASIVRHEHPNARILYLLPSRRLVPKWQREMEFFARRCVRQVDGLLRTWEGPPARPCVPTATMAELAMETCVDANRDFFATLGSFSLGLSREMDNGWRIAWNSLHRLVANGHELAQWTWPVLKARIDAIVRAEPKANAKSVFKQAYAELLNHLLPGFDLVICDEIHNLRGGVASGAARNLTMSIALGGVPPASTGAGSASTRVLPQTARPQVRRLLGLTATPFRTSFAELRSQAEVFGFGHAVRSADPVRASTNADLDAMARGDGDLETMRDETVRKYIIRRIGRLEVGGEAHTRNMYRQEYRHGSMKAPHLPAEPPSVREQLLLALVQKRVFDALRPPSGASSWRFQMGMLSSFESFGQTVQTRAEKPDRDAPIHDDADRDAQPDSRKEASAIDALTTSYRRAFVDRLPHPKLNATADELARLAWERFEKSVVFVRRVRTTEELAIRTTSALDDYMGAWIAGQLNTAGQRAAWDRVQSDWRKRRAEHMQATLAGAEVSGPTSLFAWFFRDAGTVVDDASADPSPFASIGGKLVTEDLDRSKGVWQVLLEDNPMLVLFGFDSSQLADWAAARPVLTDRAAAYAAAAGRSGRLPGWRSAVWFNAYQAAALETYARERTQDAVRSHLATELLRTNYPSPVAQERVAGRAEDVGQRMRAEHWLVLPTLFSELSRSEVTEVRSRVWPDGALFAQGDGTRPDPGRRELQRLVASQLLRNGLSYVDLWLAVVTCSLRDDLGTGLSELIEGSRTGDELFELVRSRLEGVATALVSRMTREYVEQRHTGPRDRHSVALHELGQVGANFDLVLDQNFPGLRTRRVLDAAPLIRTTLTGMAPVVAVHGQSKTTRVRQQFRMPGFPLVLVSTSVLQEGVDLHTFCRRVVHYGIDGTATGTEQRNGRVDRRGSMIERLLADPVRRDEAIHVYFPHLRQTLEPLQMARLYHRINRFMVMANELRVDASAQDDAWIATAEAVIEGVADYPEPWQLPLVSAFPAEDPADGGELSRPLARAQLEPPEVPRLLGARAEAWALKRHGGLRLWDGLAWLDVDGVRRQQPLTLAWVSGPAHRETDEPALRLRIESPVGVVQTRHHGVEDVRRVIAGWSRPGLWLQTRLSGPSRWLIFVRSEVPWNASETRESAALVAWIEHVLREADALEVDLYGSATDHAPGGFA